jgi:hypothetical protein
MDEPDLLLKTLLFGDDGDDGLEISASLYSDINRQDDSIPHPVQQFLERAALTQALGKGVDPDWNQEVSTVEKRKSGTMAQRLGIVKSEIRTEDGVRWAYGYDVAGEVVDIRALPSRS